MSPEMLEEILADRGQILALALFGVLGNTGLVLLLYFVGSRFWTRLAGPTEPPLWGRSEIGLWLFAALSVRLFFAPAIALGFSEVGAPFGVCTLLALVTTAAMDCGVIVWVVRVRGGQPLSVLGLRRLGWRSAGSATAAFVLSIFALSLWTLLWALALRELGVAPDLQDLVHIFRDEIDGRRLVSVACLITAGVLIAPISEEFVFRGFLYPWLRRHLGVVSAAVISSLLFAVVHFNVTSLLPLFVMGCILAGLYQRSGSLGAPILFHALFNAYTFANLILQANLGA